MPGGQEVARTKSQTPLKDSLSKFDRVNEGADLPQEIMKLLGGKSTLTGRISELVVAVVVVVGVVGDKLSFW